MADDALDGDPGDGSSVAAPGGSKTVTGGQSPATPGLTLEALTAAMRAEIAPLREEVARMKRDGEAQKRIAHKGGRVEGSEPNTQPSSSAPDPSKITDQATREWALQMQRENEARIERERESEAKSKKDRATTRLQQLIDTAKPARPKMLFRLLKDSVKEGLDGKIIFDDGDQIRPIEEVVREHLSDDVFKPVSDSRGTGAGPGTNPMIGAGQASQFASIADPEERLARIYEAQSKA